MTRLFMTLVWFFSVQATLCYGAQLNEIAAGEELTLVVQNEKKEKTLIKISRAWTMETLKQNIASSIQLPDTNFYITHKKVELSNPNSLCDYSTIKITHKKPEPKFIKVFIKTLHQETLTIKINPKSNVAELKVKIHEKEGTSVDQIRLIFCGRQLEDDKAIKDCGIQQYSTIHFVLRLAGD